jgi:rubredoxin
MGIISLPLTVESVVRENQGGVMDKYQCGVCGYVYDPAKGDPDGGIAPGTAFEDLPGDWTCPVCGAAKDMFEKV